MTGGRGPDPELLRHELTLAIEHDTDYDVRYGVVLHALALAHDLGLPAGIRIDPVEPAWPVVYIELPTGQVSWHMPEHPQAFDGHTTPEKHDRIRAFCGTD